MVPFCPHQCATQFQLVPPFVERNILIPPTKTMFESVGLVSIAKSYHPCPRLPPLRSPPSILVVVVDLVKLTPEFEDL